MNSLSTWAEMGGYAAFVWSAYGFALAILGGIAVQSWRRYRVSGRELDRLQPRVSPRAMNRR
jgi:heme exporter protein CcmD